MGLAMSPDSKSPNRIKKTQEGGIVAIAKIDMPEEEETGDLMKLKGVTVNKEGILMIPSQKLSLSEELCKIISNEKGKKNFVCQICDKLFPRKDKINYHIYSEHHDEFVRLGTGVPQILTKGDILNSSDQSIEDSFDGESQTDTAFFESEDIPLESIKKTSKSSKTLKEEFIQSQGKVKVHATSPIKRSPRKKSESYQTDTGATFKTQKAGEARQKIVSVPNPSQNEHEISENNSPKVKKDSSESLLNHKQPVDKEHHNDTESPIRPRRTSRKGGSGISVPQDNISVEEKHSSKGIEKKIENAVVEISHVVSKSNKLKPFGSKT